MIIKNNKELKQKGFKNEKELQTFFENNLKSILNIEFICTEFKVSNFRIDTLGFDNESKSFKIIEYKNVKNRSLVDQGYTYLKLLLERKADFVLKYNEVTNSSLRTNEIDWSQSRIIFVSPTYTTYQLNATDFQNIPVDLIKVTKYEQDIIEIDFIKKESTVKVEEIITSSVTESTKEIKVYTEDNHLENKPEMIKELYQTLREKVLELGDIDFEAKKVYIAFKGSSNILCAELFKKNIALYFGVKKGFIEDKSNLLEDVSEIGHHGSGDYRYFLSNIEQIDELIPLIKQSIKINKK